MVTYLEFHRPSQSRLRLGRVIPCQHSNQSLGAKDGPLNLSCSSAGRAAASASCRDHDACELTRVTRTCRAPGTIPTSQQPVLSVLEQWTSVRPWLLSLAQWRCHDMATCPGSLPTWQIVSGRIRPLCVTVCLSARYGDRAVAGAVRGSRRASGAYGGSSQEPNGCRTTMSASDLRAPLSSCKRQ